MATSSHTTKRERAKARLQDFTQGRSGRWVVRLTRLGYATRGFVFTLVGLVAIRAAYGIGQVAGTRGVIREMGRRTFGQVLLIVTFVGLTSYVLWRFLQAALDPFMEGSGTQSSVRRIGYFMSGLFYALLALTAGQLAFDFGREARDARRELAAWALEMPFGSWLVGAVGVVLIGVGLHAFWRAATASFMQLYPPPRADAGGKRRQLLKRVGQVGLAALGLTLCLIGGFVILAATESDPDQAVGIGGALRSLQYGPHGIILLAVVGVGFVFYGLHCFFLGAYRRIQPDEKEMS